MPPSLLGADAITGAQDGGNGPLGIWAGGQIPLGVAKRHKGPYRVEFRVKGGSAVAPEHHHPSRHVAQVLASHQQSQLPGREESRGTSQHQIQSCPRRHSRGDLLVTFREMGGPPEDQQQGSHRKVWLCARRRPGARYLMRMPCCMCRVIRWEPALPLDSQ